MPMTTREAIDALVEAEFDREVIQTIREALRARAAEFRELREDAANLRSRLRNRELQLDQLLARWEDGISALTELRQTRLLLRPENRDLIREQIAAQEATQATLQEVLDALQGGG